MSFSKVIKSAEVVYVPDENRGKSLKKLQKVVEEKYKINFDSYWDFHRWSVENIPEFWGEFWKFLGVVYSKNYDQVVDLSAPLWELEWFSGARLNFAENLLKYRDDRLALVAAGEDGETRNITYSELYAISNLYASCFRKMGLKKGDVVACYMSNRAEAIFAMLGAVSVGAIWTGALPLLGPETVIQRLSQVKPKFLITVDRFRHNNQEIEMLPKIKRLIEGLVSLEKTIIVPSNEYSKTNDISGFKNSVFLDDWLKLGRPHEMIFEQVSFSHPVFINFTSGTTGKPKAIVHGTGCLFSNIRDLVFHLDSDRDSIWFSVSPVGWASWAIFVTLLFAGCTVVLHEGVPYFYRPDYTIWDVIDEFRLTHIFVPSSALEEVLKKNHLPRKNQLSSLKVMIAGASVVKPQIFDFLYKNLPKHVLFGAGYGATELMGMCLMSESTISIYRSEISSPTLGNQIITIGENGEPVTGMMGDIVLTTPTPNFTIGLWGDSDRSLCKEKYFSKYAWGCYLGDYGIINPVTKGTVVCCRSDETLKQRGCRFGSSEIYDVVERFEEILSSICVSQYNSDMDERAVLFLRLAPLVSFDQVFEKRVRAAIARDLTIRHVPDIILQAPDIPVNINGKKMEMAVKGIINNLPYNTETIANPSCLAFYANVDELKDF